MKQRTGKSIAIAATGLALIGIAAGPASAQTAPTVRPGDSMSGRSTLTFDLPDGQKATGSEVNTDYSYNFDAETATTTYRLNDGGSLTVSLRGEHYRGLYNTLTVTSGTATYSEAGATQTYSIVGGDFAFDTRAGQPCEAVYFAAPNSGISSIPSM